MKNKNKLISLVVILIGVLLIGSGIGYHVFFNNDKKEENNQQEKTKKEKITPLMYEVTKEGSTNKMYLFGSIHVADLSKVEFPQYFEDAYKNSSYLAFEIDMLNISQEELLREQEASKYSDGTTLKDHLSEEAYKKVVDYFTKNGILTEDLLAQVKPYSISQLLEQFTYLEANLSPQEGIDLYLSTRANNDKKTLLAVETLEFQFDLLANFPDRIYELSIVDMIDNPDESVATLKELYSAWKKGDVDIINKIENEEFDETNLSESDIQMINDYNKKMIIDRNVNMTDKFEEYFNNDYNTLFTVGTAHLVGDNGIANLLTQRGYTVKQINK